MREKVPRKRRLVKFEKSRQGTTVIHRPVDMSTRVLIVPQQANYEENLELAPPLIPVENATQSILDEINRIPLTSERLSTDGHQTRNSQIMPPLHSVSALSPIEEESEEMETTYGIAFSLTNRDSSTKRDLLETDDKLSRTLVIDDREKPSEKLKAPQELAVTASQTSHPDDLPTISVVSQKDDSVNTPTSKTLKTPKKKSPKKKPEFNEDAQPIVTTVTYDDSIATQGFDVEPEVQQPIPITPESKVIYHKVGGKLKKGKKKKKKKPKKTKTSPEPKPLVLVPRKAVPFISATPGHQIDVEDDPPIKRKRKKRKRSSKFFVAKYIFYSHKSNLFFLESILSNFQRNLNDLDHLVEVNPQLERRRKRNVDEKNSSISMIRLPMI